MIIRTLVLEKSWTGYVSAKLFIIGLFAGIMVLVGDMLLGCGKADDSVPGMAGALSAYVNLSDARIFWLSILGFIGIPLEGLCYFGIYRLIAPYKRCHCRMDQYCKYLDVWRTSCGDEEGTEELEIISDTKFFKEE